MYDVVVCLPRQQALSQRYMSVAKQDMVFAPDRKLAQDGYVQRHTSQSTSMEAIRRQFINFAKQDEANYSQFVAISRLGECELKHFYYFFLIIIIFSLQQEYLAGARDKLVQTCYPSTNACRQWQAPAPAPHSLQPTVRDPL